MRPLSADIKVAKEDDTLPDGTRVYAGDVLGCVACFLHGAVTCVVSSFHHDCLDTFDSFPYSFMGPSVADDCGVAG